MDRIKKYFLILLSTLLLFSCSAHQKTTSKSYTQKSIADYQHAESSHQRKIIVQYAIQSLGISYKWGGQSPRTGFDCSGLIVYTHQKADISLPRTAKAQFDNGKALSKESLTPGDLIFFKNSQGNKIYHVAIFIGRGMFVHAPGKGRKVAYGYMDNSYFKKHYAGSRTYL